MNYIIRCHFKNNFKEWIISDKDDRKIELIVTKDVSDFDNEILIVLSIFEGKWFLELNENVSISDCVDREIQLNPNSILKLKNGNRNFNLSFNAVDDNYVTFIKYLCPDLLTIGKSESSDICFYNNVNVSQNHATLRFVNGEFGVIDSSTNGTFVNGKRVGKIKSQTFYKLKYGDELFIMGLKIIYLKDVLAINKDFIKDIRINLEECLEGTFCNCNRYLIDDYYDRSPRKMQKLDEESIEVEGPPNPVVLHEQSLFMTIGPSITMVIPMIVGVLFTQWSYSQSGYSGGPFLYMGIITSVTSAIIGVCWALINIKNNKKMAIKNEEKRKSSYIKYINNNVKLIEDKISHNMKALNQKYPSNSECCGWLDYDDNRIWENNSKHDDFLTVRIGTGKVKNINKIQIPKERFSMIEDSLHDEPLKILKKYEYMNDAPTCISFRNTKIIGIIGEKRESVLRIVINQLMVRYAYNEVKMAFLYDSNDKILSSLKWIPHTWSEDRKLRLIGSNEDDNREILNYINNEIKIRIENKSNNLPHYFIVVSKPDCLKDNNLIKQLENQNLGFTIIMLSDLVENLPNECNQVIESYPSCRYMYLDEKEEGYDDIKFDFVIASEFDKACRKLSNYRLKENNIGVDIPDTISFQKMYKISQIDKLNIYRRWLTNRSYESMKSLVGVSSNGRYTYLDIHEKVHGPHGLVAGTTGSGKSEFLQTFILSLAINYHPYEVSFILIDYKGGGMAQSFDKLPHTLGVITNLGGNQTIRALSSIKAEIKRRQRIFNYHHLKHIDEYIELYRNKQIDKPLPHLIIIADEFAELKKEQPDFVRELVSASRIGRSLGVHLILATQKPSGVVDEEIWGNSRFRVCLKVQDKQDSNDMLKRTDAAYITNVGRAYLQVGNNEIFDEFQSAWSGAQCNEDQDYNVKKYDVKIINILGKSSIITKHSKGNNKKGKTQLEVITSHIRRVFDENRLKALDPIWLPPLPKVISLKDLHVSLKELDAVLGVVDDPERQNQYPFIINMFNIGNLLVTAQIGGGKTTFLHTLIYSLITNNLPNRLHVYCVDYGNRSLNVFQDAPHVGGVVLENENKRVGKLFSFLKKEINSRKHKLSLAGINNFKEYFTKNNDLNVILIVLDNVLAFLDSNENLESDFAYLLREGSAFGIYFVVTAQKSSDLRVKMMSSFGSGVAIQMADRFEYEATIGERVEFLAEKKIPGRGIVKLDRPLEFQTAIVGNTTDSLEINNIIIDTVRALKDKYNNVSNVKKLAKMPDDMSIESFISLPEVQNALQSRRYLPIGYDIDEIELVSLDLSKTMCITVGGNQNSGKSTFLYYLMQLNKEAADIYMICDKENNIYRDCNVKQYISSKEELYAFFKENITPTFGFRNSNFKKPFVEQKLSIDEHLKQMKPIYIFIDNFTEFIAMIYQENNLAQHLEYIFENGKLHGIYFIARISNEDYQSCILRGVFQKYISDNTGIYLGGMTTQQHIFEFDLPLSVQGKRLEKGLAYTNKNGKTITVSIPRKNEVL